MTVKNVDFYTETSSNHLKLLLNSYSKQKNELQSKSIDWCPHEWNQGQIKKLCRIKRESFIAIVNAQSQRASSLMQQCDWILNRVSGL